jgi:hypothetical protein
MLYNRNLGLQLFDSGVTALTTTGKTYSHQFTKAGDFPYFCELHPDCIADDVGFGMLTYPSYDNKFCSAALVNQQKMDCLLYASNYT